MKIRKSGSLTPARMFVILGSSCPEMMAPRVGGAVKREAATAVSDCVAFSGNRHLEAP